MTHAILVVSPSAAFGELIRQSLERNGDFRVQACQSADEALVLCRATLFAIAILDGDLANLSLPRLGHEIQRRCPGVQLAVFPPDNNPKSPALAGGAFQAFLKKPFYLPTLQKTIQKLLTEPVQTNRPAQQAADESSPDTPEDQRVTGDTHKERDCSPALHQTQCGASVAEAARNDTHDGLVEAARNDTYYGKAEAPTNDEGSNEGPPVESEENQAETAWPDPILPPRDLLAETPEDEPPDAAPAINLQELEKMGLAWIGPEALEQPAVDHKAPVDQPEILPPIQPTGEVAGEVPASAAHQAAPAAHQAAPEHIQPGADSHVKDTQPLRIKGMAAPTLPEAPATQSITCALTPLLAEHYLRSDQMNALRKSMLEISAAQGWQIVWLSIRPSHVAWTVCIPASIAPETMVKVYRQGASEGLFRAYPSLGYQNPSGDFWAPGSLLTPGERSLSRQAIYDFVAAAHPLRGLYPSSLIPHP